MGPHSPACRMGPLSVLPPKPNLSQKGGAQWASQWQFFLLLHTFGAEVDKTSRGDRVRTHKTRVLCQIPSATHVDSVNGRPGESTPDSTPPVNWSPRRGGECRTNCLCLGAAVESQLPFPGLFSFLTQVSYGFALLCGKEGPT